MKSIYNPTESEVKITIKGDIYSVEAGSKTTVSEVVAEKWVATHGFLQMTEAKETPKEKEVEVAKEEVSGNNPRDIPVEEEKKESVIKRVLKSKK